MSCDGGSTDDASVARPRRRQRIVPLLLEGPFALVLVFASSVGTAFWQNVYDNDVYDNLVPEQQFKPILIGATLTRWYYPFWDGRKKVPPPHANPPLFLDTPFSRQPPPRNK